MGDRSAPRADVIAALVALTGTGDHPIHVAQDGADRVTGTWSSDLAGRPAVDGGIMLAGRSSWSWHVTLLDGGEYRASMSARNMDAWNGSFTSSWIARPMKDVLAAHGWTRRRSALGRAVSRLLGR